MVKYLLLFLPPHVVMGLRGSSSIFVRVLAPFLPRSHPLGHPGVRASFMATPEMEWKCCKSLPRMFCVLPCVCFPFRPGSVLHCCLPCHCHVVTFPPSLTLPNLKLNQTAPNARAGRAWPHCPGVQGEEESVMRNPINKFLHNCMTPEVKNLKENKTQHFLQGSLAPQS